MGQAGATLDPSVPEVLEQVQADIRRLVGWGYEMIKHDFSTFDVTGRWGFDMNGADGIAPTGWSYADRSHTTAEILLRLYRAIRNAAGPQTLIIGCNTVSHLSAGLVEIQRTGDDTSAHDWDRTRRMGVNTLAFRAVQHGAFYAVDADCVPVSPKIPWQLTSSWMDLVSRSGTPLFISIDPSMLGLEQQSAISHALEVAVELTSVAEPRDWMERDIPEQWKLEGDRAENEAAFRWSESEEKYDPMAT